VVGYVQFESSLDFGSDALIAMRKAFLSAAGGAMLAALLLGLLVSQRLTAPLRQLTTAAGRMGSGDLSARAKVRSDDETGRLATQFNVMADRLQSSFAELAAERDALRRFIADASHELRTPITALRSFNDLLRGAAAEDVSAREEFLAESQVQIDRLEWITSNLLDLSRLDAGLIDLNLGHHDISEVIQSATSGYRERALEEGLSLDVLTPEEPLPLSCDRARIELAISNLLDNAIKFTPSGGNVQIGARAEGDAVLIWVEDNGSGIDQEDLPHIFDRFYRGRHSEAGGSGLGLSIARAIFEAHGGSVSVDSAPSQGSSFLITLPVS
jgi:signal transduction histidine kinase